MHAREQDLERIRSALEVARAALLPYIPGQTAHRDKRAGNPVTEADLAVNEVLRRILPTDGDGWLSEETEDDAARLGVERVWVVDPIDGTREFIDGIPEWCVSVGLLERGVPIAGGILAPSSDLVVVGGAGVGCTANGEPCRVREVQSLAGAEVLASRSEFARGEWKNFEDGPFTVRPMGSVAFKLALVAAGRTDATWTLVPKHEWDVVGGIALVLAAGGEVWVPGGGLPKFNRPVPRIEGLVATARGLSAAVRACTG